MRITVHDVSKRRIGTAADADFTAGVQVARWTRGETGERPRPEVYFARTVADGVEIQQRVVVLSR